jgi:hypothetical protein
MGFWNDRRGREGSRHRRETWTPGPWDRPPREERRGHGPEPVRAHRGRLAAGLTLVLVLGLAAPGAVFAVVATAAGVSLAPPPAPPCARREVYLDLQALVRDTVERTYGETPEAITFEGFVEGGAVEIAGSPGLACRAVSTVLAPAAERRFTLRYDLGADPEGRPLILLRDLVHTDRRDRPAA